MHANEIKLTLQSPESKKKVASAFLNFNEEEDEMKNKLKFLGQKQKEMSAIERLIQEQNSVKMKKAEYKEELRRERPKWVRYGLIVKVK